MDSVELLVEWRKHHPDRWPKSGSCESAERKLGKWLQFQRYAWRQLSHTDGKSLGAMSRHRAAILDRRCPGWMGNGTQSKEQGKRTKRRVEDNNDKGFSIQGGRSKRANNRSAAEQVPTENKNNIPESWESVSERILGQHIVRSLGNPSCIWTLRTMIRIHKIGALSLDCLKHAYLRPCFRGTSALHVAAKHSDLEVIEFLINICHEDPHALDSWGESALAVAAEKGQTNIVSLMLSLVSEYS
jgi:hypothetical protein